MPVSRHEKQNKKSNKWRYVYGKFGITQRFNIEDTCLREKSDSSDGSEKVTYEEML